MTLAHWDDAKGFDVPDAVQPLGGRWQSLGDAAGSLRVGTKRVVLSPGQMITPPHQHPAEEEIFHVLAGSATLWQDGSTCEVAADDTIVHVAGGPAHTLIAGDDGLEVLIFGQRLMPEACVLPRTHVAWLGDKTVQLLEADPWVAEAALGIPEGTPGDRPANVVALDGLEGFFGGMAKRPGQAAGAKQTGLNWTKIPPNDEGAPPHCHSADEEVFVILDGEGALELWAPPQPGDTRQTTPQETHPLRRGHVISRPPATRISHSFRSGDAGLTYLVYGTREPNDMCYYPRSNKVFLRGLGVIARLENLSYGDGEPG
ncbi:MAG TPA: cupin domain-containing protein [Gaiellaceae bacterium]